MRYMGGKFHIAKPIAGLINQLRLNGQPYLEPFVGGCNIVPRIIGGVRIASDANPYLITMYKALQQGWEPPQTMTREQWQDIKQRMDVNDPLTAFAGFGCSFAGVMFAGFADFDKRHPGTSYCGNAYSATVRLREQIKSIEFNCHNYQTLNPKGACIYCDPPYVKTAGYKTAQTFNHTEFWQTMRDWSKSNTVLISEYVAPPDFVPIWQQRKTTGLRDKTGRGLKTIECVFQHESQARLSYPLHTQDELFAGNGQG